jgi:hypothetical protein
MNATILTLVQLIILPQLSETELEKNHVNNPILCIAQFGKKECWMLIVGV